MSQPFDKEQELVELMEETDLSGVRDLIIYNDDFNTFEHVINTLIRICRHSVEQAEQCTLIIHYKGKCAVKKGTFNELKPMCLAICDAGLSAEIV